MTSREPFAKLGDAMSLLQMLERLVGCDSETDRLWYIDMR